MQIGEKSSPTFHEPLELLSDCHRRVERFLGDLVLVAERKRGEELSALEREALTAALRYFREAAPKHTADEEESLFPRMRAGGGELVAEAFTKIAALEADHERAKVSHGRIELLGQRWLTKGKLHSVDLIEMLEHLSNLQAMYQQHIRVEDEEIFPLAARIVGRDALNAIGQEMAARRGQKLSPAGPPGR